MPGNQGVMWPRLVATKILKRRSGNSSFVADIPNSNNEVDIPNLGQPSLRADSIFNHQKFDTHIYKVFVSTWNVGGIAPSEYIDMEDWLDTPDICDIYVFGFQEIVPLRASNVLGSENSKNSMKWNSLIRGALNKKINQSYPIPQDFRCIISKQMVGILISVWARSDICPYVRHPSVFCVGCGIMGCLGNKGSVSVRFQLHETSFCFICSHLASGGKQGDERHRNSDVSEILSRTNFSRGPSLDLPRKILDHDRIIFLGDLNYRISLPEATTRFLVDKEEWNALLENDQLRMELMSGQIFDGWHEGTVKFAPTYKYCPNSNVYFGCVHGKGGQKWRSPAWCDRIIWHGEGLKQHVYTRGETNFSDHRPVKAIFTVEVDVLQTFKEFQQLFLSDRFDPIADQFNISSSNKFLCNGRLSFNL